MTRKLVLLGVAIMTTLLALVILWQFRTPVVYLLVSLALAAAVRPVVKRWSRQGFVVRLALIFLFVLSLGSFGFLFVLGGGSALSEINQLAKTVAVQDEWMLPEWLGNSIRLPLAERLPSPSELFAAFTGDQGQLVLPAILGFTRGIAGLVSGVLVILFLSFYWSLNQVHFERLWLSLLPPGQRNRARNIWQTIEADLGVYIRSQVVLSLLAGLLLGLGYWALGSPYPTLLALVGALASLIPMVGVGLAVILPLFIGLLTSVQLGLLTALYTLVVLIALEVWVKPRLFNHRQYNPILDGGHPDCHGKNFWFYRHNRRAALIGCNSNPVEAPGCPSYCTWNCVTAIGSSGAVHFVTGRCSGYERAAFAISDQQHGATYTSDG
jgi:predicted PurR-regulated permease PerM